MKILGFFMILSGIALGFYVGVWVCFVGGIVDVIQQIRAETLQAAAVAWGVAKIAFAGLFGWISSMFLIVPGYFIISD